MTAPYRQSAPKLSHSPRDEEAAREARVNQLVAEHRARKAAVDGDTEERLQEERKRRLERREREVQLQGVVELGVQGPAGTSRAPEAAALQQLRQQVAENQQEIDQLRSNLEQQVEEQKQQIDQLHEDLEASQGADSSSEPS